MEPNWQPYRIADFIEINPKVPLKNGFKYSFVEMKDLNPSNKYVFPSAKRDLKGGSRFQNSDTLFARITPCLENGKICQVKCLDNNQGFGSTEFLVFRGKSGISDSDFIYYLARTPFFRKFSESKMIGTSGRQRVSKDAYDFLELSLPPLEEQRTIASILSALDDKIELNLQMNKTLEEMAMTLYEHWFVDFGPFRDGEFVSSELGEIPKGWEVKRLPEVSINHNKKRAPISTRERSKIGGEYPYYGATKILDYINDYRFDGEFILLAEDGTVKTERDTPFLQFIEGKFWVSNHAHVLSGRNNYSNEFLYLCLSNTNVIPIITGAVQLKINKENLETLKFICPDILSLGRFQEITIPLFKQIKSNEKENEVLITLRDTLLPKLINGEVRVKETTKTFEEVL